MAGIPTNSVVVITLNVYHNEFRKANYVQIPICIEIKLLQERIRSTLNFLKKFLLF